MGIIIDASGLIPLMKYYIRFLLGAAALNIKPIRWCAMLTSNRYNTEKQFHKIFQRGAGASYEGSSYDAPLS